MQKIHSVVILALAAVLIIAACKKVSYPNPGSPIVPYSPAFQVGKYITYRLDSLAFYYYGQKDTITSYLAKDSVEEAFTDNQGRPSWRIVRYLTDATGTLPWAPTETYSVTPTSASLEMNENNLRVVKLALPLSEGYSWSGNSYLPYDPYQDFFDFSDASHLNLKLWNFTYQNVNQPYTINNQTYDSTVTVLQVNDSINVPILIDTSFASRSYWSETYSKNIGLIYRHTILWEYQPPTPNNTQVGYKIGFEMTLSMIDHN
ncbi:hypothetical protein ACX0G9_16315 [Flavitalea flava]